MVIIQRNLLFEELWDFADWCRSLGRLVVLDLDDDYPGLPATNPAYGFWIANSAGLDPDPVARLTEGLHHVDALTSPSRVILEDWEGRISGLQTLWVPNLASLSWWSYVEPRREDGRIIIGWGGSVSHLDSFWDSGVREALKVLTREYPEVFLMVCGNDRRLQHKPPAPKEKVIFQTGVAPWLWPQIVAKFDIGIAPLAGEYDRRRSWIKVAEYALAGVPAVFTDWEPYEELRPVGVPVQNGARNWYGALKEVIDNLIEARRIAEAQRSWAIQNLTMLPNVNRYVGLFETLTPQGTVWAPGVMRL